MNISERFRSGLKFITGKALWIISIPILLDLTNLFMKEKLYHSVYKPAEKIFLFKIGFISAPPSVAYLLEDFPTTLLKYDSNGLTGIISRISLFNVALTITILLILSFISSGYMSVLGTSLEEKVRIKDFFVKGNKNWHKFFLLNLICFVPLILIALNEVFIVLAFINVIFVYVPYSFAVDDVKFLQHLKLGIRFLFINLALSIKMAIYFGLIFSFFSVFTCVFARMGTIGVIVDIIFVSYLGACTNRAILEIYSISAKEMD
ncbi:hypothetical protein [Clostridium manihotivorum]|uniref:DUF975 family protein n=1 Tax=Clostridium manihotivorum TaxID=2320868 RepID=A0A410DTL3_9CLOT|nr:hypothetical protein [Clostridium manihotivorum]QAA32454.1 hypothetical protein C1I91_12840 [Clostridium manihotivorum]